MPTHVPSMFLLGAGSYALGRLEYARANLEKVLARQPDHAPAQAAAGRHAISSSPWPSGTTSTRRARASACSGSILPPCRALRRIRTAAGATEAAEAGRLARAGDHDAAAKILAELEGAAPDSPVLLELRGGLALLAGRASAAARAFEAAHQDAPAGVLARKLAFAQWQAGQRATSQATLEAWLTRSPGDLETQLTLADLHLAAGRTAAARRASDPGDRRQARRGGRAQQSGVGAAR